MSEPERLQRVLSRVGFGSRRVCEDLIAEGRVSVNDEIAVLGRRVEVVQRPRHQQVGVRIEAARERAALVLQVALHLGLALYARA